MWDLIHPSLRTADAAERSLLRYLASHAEDRFLVSTLLNPSDFHCEAHRKIYTLIIMTMPTIAAGDHADYIQESLTRMSDASASECFETVRDAPVLGGWVVALQIAAYILLLSAYRHDDEQLNSLLLDPTADMPEDDLW